MKKIKILATALFLAQSVVVFGQLERQNGLSITIKGPNTKIDGVTAKDASAQTQHLRFLTEEYQEAKVDALTDKFYFRYNIFADEMEFIKDGTVYFLSKTENQIINFVNLGRKFTVLNLNGELKYFEINSVGNASLYTKKNVGFIEGKVAKTQFESSKKAKFIEKKDDYFVILNSELIKLPKGKKDFYNLFGDKSSNIKTFMKQEKLNRKKIADVIKVFNYYNSI